MAWAASIWLVFEPAYQGVSGTIEGTTRVRATFIETNGLHVIWVPIVPGLQAVLDRDGQIIDRHDGRGDGPRRLDAVLQDRAAMRRIVEGLKSDEDVRPRETLAEWAHSVQFGGITYLAKGSWFGSIIANGERALTTDDLGPELYRVAFRRVGYAGSYRYLDGDATYLNPDTPVYAVKGYVPEFRLATLEEGRVTLFEADTNPLATTGEDLLDIRGKVTAVRILSTDYARTVLGTIDEESQVERFVELVLQSPVDQEHRDHEGLSYFLGFRLADGTSVVRSFWLESGELWRGIMTDPIVASIALSSLPNDHEMEVQTPITAKSPSPTGTPTPISFQAVSSSSFRRTTYFNRQSALLYRRLGMAERASTDGGGLLMLSKGLGSSFR